MNWKVIINLNYYKSMLATIHSMFLNEKIIGIYLFCPLTTQHETQDKYILREV